MGTVLDHGLRPVAVGPQPLTTTSAGIAPRIDHAVSLIKTPHAPTAKEREYLWVAAMDDAADLIAANRTEKAVRLFVADLLWETGLPLAKNRESLRKQYRKRRAAWSKSGGAPDAIRDRRAIANADRRWTIPDEDGRQIIRRAVTYESLAKDSAKPWPTARFQTLRPRATRPKTRTSLYVPKSIAAHSCPSFGVSWTRDRPARRPAQRTIYRPRLVGRGAGRLLAGG